MKGFITAIPGYIYFLQPSETDSHHSSGTRSTQPLIFHAEGEGKGGDSIIMDITGLWSDWSRLLLHSRQSCLWEWNSICTPYYSLPEWLFFLREMLRVRMQTRLTECGKLWSYLENFDLILDDQVKNMPATLWYVGLGSTDSSSNHASLHIYLSSMQMRVSHLLMIQSLPTSSPSQIFWFFS